MSVSYTYVEQPANVGVAPAVGVNGNPNRLFSGLSPDITRLTEKALEDSTFYRTSPITSSMKGVYIPHDPSSLDLKTTTTQSGNITQRITILVIGAQPSSTIGRVNLTMNCKLLILIFLT